MRNYGLIVRFRLVALLLVKESKYPLLKFNYHIDSRIDQSTLNLINSLLI
jgi:hypothetical protein